jgi:ABC-type antimicrobial peptide transport system permease subunit
MSINTTPWLLSKKFKANRTRYILFISPLIILFTLAVVLLSVFQSFLTVADSSIISTALDSQSFLILQKARSGNGVFGGGRTFGTFSGNQSDTYTQNDVETIKNIANVKSATIIEPAPLSSATTTDLFSGKKISLSNFTALDPNYALAYTKENFEDNSSVVPIVLNANQFFERVVDFGGQTSVDINITRGTQGAAPVVPANSPIKSNRIDYTKSDLIGKTFTAGFGTLSDIESYTPSQSATGITITKLTEEQIKTLTDARTASLSPYWDVAKLTAPINYTFKVVGVTESDTDQSVYVPAVFASRAMTALINKQVTSRTSTDIPTELLDNVYRGLDYDGVQLSGGSGNTGRGFLGLGGGNRGGPPGTQPATTTVATASYTIPGLVLNTARSTDPNATTTAAVTINTDTAIYDKAALTGTKIAVKMSSYTDRTQVVSDLHAKSYDFNDVSQIGQYTQIRTTINNLINITTYGFIALTSILTALILIRLTVEGRREIGIFRAIGMTRTSIQVLYIMQGFVLGMATWFIGGILGIIITKTLSPLIYNYYNNNVENLLKKSFDVVKQASSSDFGNIDIKSLSYLSAVLIGLFVIVSVISAYIASRISPVEAIRSEQ